MGKLLFASAPLSFLGRRPARGHEALGTAELAAFSNLAGTAFRRHVQSLHENGDLRNPDILAGALLSARQRADCMALSADALQAMRREPFYAFLVARTKAYDQLLLDAVAEGARRVLIVGAGYDTRLHRFGSHLAAQGVEVAECDQPQAVQAKQVLAAGLPFAARVAYLGADLNEPGTWGAAQGWLAGSASAVFVMAEGVSPYIEQGAFEAFLRSLRGWLGHGCRVAYDFKRAGVADGFGRRPGVASPFRVQADAEAVAALHHQMGYADVAVSGAGDLMQRHAPSWRTQDAPSFDEDLLVELRC